MQWNISWKVKSFWIQWKSYVIFKSFILAYESRVCWNSVDFKLFKKRKGLVVKNPPVNAGDAGTAGLIPGLGRSPWGGNGYSLWYSCLENPMAIGAWWATVHGDHRVGQDWVIEIVCKKSLPYIPRKWNIRTTPTIFQTSNCNNTSL